MATSGGFPLIAIEIVIGFLVPVAWAVWELVKLRREQRLDAEKARSAQGHPHQREDDHTPP
jgi:hypothetical protein